MNLVLVQGNLVRDPELRVTQTNKTVASFTVATTDTFMGSDGNIKEATSYINCVAWGKLGDNVGKLKKGNKIFVNGRLATRSYEDKDGKKRYVTEVVCNFAGADIGTSVEASSTEVSSFESAFSDPNDLPF